MGEQRRGAAVTTVLLAALVASACVPDDPDGEARRASAPEAASPGRVIPGAAGPFDGLRWSGRPASTGRLLHDDGTRLWSLGLNGSTRVLWRHPAAAVTTIAASAGGRRIALGVTAGDRRLDEGDASAFLYLLEPDGSVRRVDTLDEFRVIESPVFLRPPTAPGGPERLYWIRFSDVIDDAGRLRTQVMVDDGEARRVHVPLRFGEGVLDLHAYPGSTTFTFTLFRQNDVPTRFAVLRNDDISGATDATLTLWGTNEERADTDSGVGVAWTRSSDYVVPVVHEFDPGGYSLRRFRVGCEARGSEVVYQGGAIDRGFEELPWKILPAGPHRVLVLTDRDTRALVAGRSDTIRWHAVDLRSGELAASRLTWRPDGGGWTWVAPEAGDGADGCGGVRWAVP